MNALRRAIGRKEIILALLLVLLPFGWVGWHRLMRPASAQVAAPASPAAQVKALLDAGKFIQAVTQAESLLTGTPSSTALPRYKAIAQFLAGDAVGAMQTADRALAGGAGGVDGAALLAVKALVLSDYEHHQPAAAKVVALPALEQAGSDPEAGLLARLACAAALRGELDLPAPQSDLLKQASQMRQVLEPLYPGGAAEPKSAWESRFWRWGLALLADAAILAGEAGDPAGEVASVALVQRLCPADVWASYLKIPERALQSVRAPIAAGHAVDDHARIALYTAAGLLYTQAGDRLHCDTLFRKAITCYVRLLNTADDWSGAKTDAVVPSGEMRSVGQEFYLYRNRVELVAKYCADFWGMRVVDSKVSLQTAMDACDYKIFRALVRLRGDKDAGAAEIAAEEYLRPDYMETLAAWLEKFPYEPQAAWEKDRASLLRRIAGEQIHVRDVLRRVDDVVNPADPNRDVPAAVALLQEALADSPAIPLNRIRLRWRLAGLLMEQRLREEVVSVLDAALDDAQQPDPYLGTPCPWDPSEALLLKFKALVLSGQFPPAIAFAESAAADARYGDDLHLRMLKDLAVFYAYKDREAALRVRQRIQDYALPDGKQEDLRQALLQIVSNTLERAAARRETTQR
jgi:hypothetical protein